MTGQTIGRYAIESKLVEGGMGVVFRARDTHPGRTNLFTRIDSSADELMLVENFR